MVSWFGKKKTPGGSVVLRHNDPERQIGSMDDSAVGFTHIREAAYERLLGKALSVSHELLPQVPHVDVYTFQSSSGDQTWYSLVTGGMSDLEMAMPRHAKGVPRRVELIFYCAEPRDEYIATLRWLAHFPHDSKSWLDYGHTMPNGTPPTPIWDSAELDTFLFMPPIVMEHQTLPSELELKGEPVHFLWVVPLTTPECNLKLEKGFDVIFDLFEQNRHPHVFDPDRKSYV